jgi:isoleucyl-tRNA synthetase
MDELRELARLGRAAREEAGIRVRQPLARMLCVVPAAHVSRMRPLLPLLASELNVKECTLLTSADELVELSARPNFRALGRKFGKATPVAAKAVASLSGDALRAFERGEPLAITVESQSHHLEAEDLTILRRAAGSLVVKEALGLFVAIDPHVTPSLRQEGLARELVSRIQRMRKDSGLAVSDRIRLHVGGAPEIESVAREYQDWIAAEVLAREIGVGDTPAGVEYARQSVEIEGLVANVALTRES